MAMSTFSAINRWREPSKHLSDNRKWGRIRRRKLIGFLSEQVLAELMASELSSYPTQTLSSDASYPDPQNEKQVLSDKLNAVDAAIKVDSS